MEHQGIEISVRRGMGENRWVWTAHTPIPRRGTVTGKRDTAILNAQRAVDQWRYKHPWIGRRAGAAARESA
jgi:hypothetical protein